MVEIKRSVGDVLNSGLFVAFCFSNEFGTLVESYGLKFNGKVVDSTRSVLNLSCIHLELNGSTVQSTLFCSSASQIASAHVPRQICTQ